MIVPAHLGVRLAWQPRPAAAAPDQVQQWQDRIDRHEQMQSRLLDIASQQKSRSLKFGALALLGSAAGAGLALAAPALLIPGLYLGGAALLGAGLFALKARSVSREAIERHELGKGGLRMCRMFLDQYQREADEQQRQVIAGQLEGMSRNLAGGGGALGQADGVLTVGGARLKQRASY